jgi:hypothetical protein
MAQEQKVKKACENLHQWIILQCEEDLERSSSPKEIQAYVDTLGPIYTKAWKAMTIKNLERHVMV